MTERSDIVPPGKYNAWCERRPLVCPDRNRLRNSDRYIGRSDLTISEKSAFHLREIVDCGGLEFVVFSNGRINQQMVLPNQIVIHPCFVPTNSRLNLNHPLVRLTRQMEQRARFIYDGWLPITNWQEQSVRESIRNIDTALSLFSVGASVWFSWEPKYYPIIRQGSYCEYGINDISKINQITQFIDSLNQEGAKALLRSIAWFAQSHRQSEPAARFLFNILAIESLGMYIQGDLSSESAFIELCSQRLPREQRREQRIMCITDIIGRLVEVNPEEAIQTAYFECMFPIKKTLKEHLEIIFNGYPEAIDLLFNTEIDGKTLYDLRHDIAHGRLDALSEVQREVIYQRLPKLEEITRLYISGVISIARGSPLNIEPIINAISFRLQDGIISHERMYQGPIHMAEVYSLT